MTAVIRWLSMNQGLGWEAAQATPRRRLAGWRHRRGPQVMDDWLIAAMTKRELLERWRPRCGVHAGVEVVTESNKSYVREPLACSRRHDVWNIPRASAKCHWCGTSAMPWDQLEGTSAWKGSPPAAELGCRRDHCWPPQAWLRVTVVSSRNRLGPESNVHGRQDHCWPHAVDGFRGGWYESILRLLPRWNSVIQGRSDNGPCGRETSTFSTNQRTFYPMNANQAMVTAGMYQSTRFSADIHACLRREFSSTSTVYHKGTACWVPAYHAEALLALQWPEVHCGTCYGGQNHTHERRCSGRICLLVSPMRPVCRDHDVGS